MQSLSKSYPVWLCDIWGVVHDGFTPFAATQDCLKHHRSQAGTVILLTNSPRTAEGVHKQLLQIGVDPAAWDAIVTSGDVTRSLMLQHGNGKLFHLGPSRDLSLFAGLDVERVALDDAQAIICTGLFDEYNETPENYRGMFATFLSRNMVFICANPDKLVRKGDKLLYCAGALAELYAQMGGKVVMAGKPYQPIYDLAMREVARRRGHSVAKPQVLAIGDGPDTDIKGAADYGLAVVLVTGGINHGGAGLEAEVRAAHPHANIVAAMPELGWSSV